MACKEEKKRNSDCTYITQKPLMGGTGDAVCVLASKTHDIGRRDAFGLGNTTKTH